MATFRIELSERDLQKLIQDHIQKKLGSYSFDKEKVVIEVKSKQNYRSEWERAAFRAVYEGEV